MNKEQVIANTVTFVKKTLKNAEGGHDWFHILRVWNNAKLIAKTENVDLFIVELGALLHDIADSKFYNGDETVGPKVARAFLEAEHVSEEIIRHIEQIITNISYKGGNFKQTFISLELNVIQDADRLDAIGAIGIARCFNYGGFKNRQLYNPEIAPKLNMSKEEYKKSDSPTINHFYEKLLLLKDKMNTVSGKKIAEERHIYMENFLQKFYSEWNGNS
ncbi:HD domain-containing protein [Lutibacter sp. A64]|uniref:HD domain-containing protein n=1 Tax=Lutibacter sp. A64 TaxID=2918526 RepID=UPI001F06ACAB|nr:HD domain-containing protein [Lutibacter sp. A64]UMB52803.1 HD domain-containing protein [Lutibacter sp. A64]